MPRMSEPPFKGQMYGLQICSPQSVVCLFIHLIGSFAKRQFLILKKSNLSIFLFMAPPCDGKPKNFCLALGSVDFSYSFPKIFTVCTLQLSL